MTVNTKSPASRRFGMGASACALLIAAMAAGAARAAPATDADGRSTRLEPLTVTAERRTTALQETPVAATVLTTEKLENERIVNFADLAINVPNLTFTQFSTQESYFSIRGTLINNNAAGYDDAVSVFIDDVPATGLGDANPDLFDLSSVEVLRGPQGTLFGRNVTGGAIVIHTQPPSFTFGGRAEGTYGSHNYAQFRGLITGPLAPTVAGKVSVDVTHEDNYVRNVVLGGGTGGTNFADVRGQILWDATPNVDVLLGVDYLHDWSGGYATKLLGTFEPALFPNLCYDPNCTNQGFNGVQHRDIAGAMARVNWRTSLGAVTSITGFRYVNNNFPNTVLGDPANQIPTVGIVQDRQFTQEFRLASPSDQRLTYVLGAFFLNGRKREAGITTIQFVPGGVIGGPTFLNVNDQVVTSNDYAVFGEGNYALTDALKLTFGARENYERKSGRSIVTYSPTGVLGLPPGDATYAHGWSSFTPKFGVSYQPVRHLLLYATVARGFKSGGYDTSGASGTTTAEVNQLLATPFRPETVWNYELGEKLTGFDGRLTFDVDVFRADYKDLQTNQIINVNNNFLSVTTNAAGARTQGVELEATAVPVDWLTLGLTYAYMDAKFTDYPGVNGAPANTGNTIPYSPRHQVHASAEVHWPVASLGGARVAVGGDFTYHSAIFFTNANDTPPFFVNRSIWKDIINIHATVESADHKWKLLFWGKNITNDRALLHGADITVTLQSPAPSDFTPGNFIFLAKYYQPRTFGVTLTHDF